MKTEQEQFWAGVFGDEYTERNQGDNLLASNIALFAWILRSTQGLQSVLEFGANTGLNLKAIKALMPWVWTKGVEINEQAYLELTAQRGAGVDASAKGSILDWGQAGQPHCMTLSKGLLIHIDPVYLPVAYKALYESSHKYICLAEYYNPVPVEVEYRGHKGKLFKRDFAGEMMDMFPLELVDYGFAYRGDNNFEQDDLHWFLLRKVTS